MSGLVIMGATSTEEFTPTDKSPNKRFRHVRELDGIRGIAALAVMCHHLFYTNINWRIWPWPERWAGAASQYGQFGVDLFFVLSGFLITSLLLQDRDDPHYYHNFYWKRALRILPLYFVVLIVLVISDHKAFPYALLCVVFLANFNHVFHIPMDGPFWTLAIEEQFYLLWPRIIQHTSVDSVSKLAGVIIVTETVVRLISAAFGHVNFVFTFYHCDGLAFGALLACQYRRWHLEPSLRGQKSRGIFRWIALGALVLGALCIYCLQHPPAYLASALLLTAAGLLFYAVIGGVVKYSGRRFLIPFRSQPLVFFGEISYCMYMVHGYVLLTYDAWRGPVPTGDALQYAIRVLAVLGTSIVVCVFSLHVIERPIQSLRRYVLRKG
jgi:peptidoglycan/LPS O-acetylase OafA/YrhL